MTTEENKALVRRLYDEVVNAGDVDKIDEFVSEDVIEHEEFPGLEPNREGVKQFFRMFLAAFPDLRFDVHDMLAEDDKVAARLTMTGTHKGEFMGIPASGRRIEVGAIDILRLEGGLVVEHWGETDTMGMMEQLGALPAE